MGVLGDAANPFVYPPHLLATAAAVLRAARWRVAGLDAVAQGLDADAVLERLPRSDVLVLPVSYGTQAADRAFLNRLRERQPLARVLAIGPALSYAQVDHVFSDLADALLMGEPELALPAAAARLLAGDLPPGRAVNPYTLAAEHYTPDGLLLDLDAVPMPAWELFHSQQQPYPFLSVLSSRGCPAGCGFCPYVAAQGDTLRSQSPARTADELVHVAQRYHVGHVMLRDPVFALDRNRVLAICSELRRRKSTVTWECESRPEHFDSRLLRAMHDAGCTTVKLGLESADPDVLMAVGRVADERAAEAVPGQRRRRGAGLPTGGHRLPGVRASRPALPDTGLGGAHRPVPAHPAPHPPARQGLPLVSGHCPAAGGRERPGRADPPAAGRRAAAAQPVAPRGAATAASFAWAGLLTVPGSYLRSGMSPDRACSHDAGSVGDRPASTA